MNNISAFFLIIILLVGGAFIASVSYLAGVSSEDHRPPNPEPLNLEVERAKYRAKSGRNLSIPHPYDR